MERHSEVVLETALVSLCTLDIGLKIIIIINNNYILVIIKYAVKSTTVYVMNNKYCQFGK